MSATDVGRKPLTVVEVEQPNKAGTGTIKWRFMDDRPGVFAFGNYANPDALECDPLPCLASVSTSENQINAGSNMDGRSPLGVTGKATVTLQDFPWNDAFGDWPQTGIPAGTAPPVLGNFWALWTARNELFSGMYLRIYDGYEGEALASMRQRLYILDNVDGPDGDGRVTLTGLDPLRLAGDKKAEFPRTSVLDLYGGINASTTTIVVFGVEADLTADFGNTGANRYLGIGTEIILYTGYTIDGAGKFTLTGVTRGALASVAASHKDKDKIQRIGRYETMSFWRVLNDLFVNHTTMPATFIPLTEWDAEGNKYLPTYKATHTVVKPTPVETLAGQISQQGLFYIWWSEYDQKIKLLAIRAPDQTPNILTDEGHLMRGSVLKRDPKMRITQIAVYYELIDPFGGLEDDKNYQRRFTAVDATNQGETRAVAIHAPWIRNRTQAVQLAMRLLIRYRRVPKFLTVTIDAKDRTATVGSVLDIQTRTIIDADGNVDTKRWQVISAKELRAGHSYILDCQTYEFIGRFGRYMAGGSPVFTSATDAQKKTGGWYAGPSGLMSDGSEGYKYQ